MIFFLKIINEIGSIKVALVALGAVAAYASFVLLG